MSLDAFVRCNCVRDGKAKPHPFADRLTFDKREKPSLSGDVSEEDWETHDRRLSESCDHQGFMVGESLGKSTPAKHLRDFLGGLQGDPTPRFPILLKKVVYDGTHTGDWIGSKEAAQLLPEVDTVLHSSDILSESEKGFSTSMKRPCEARIATGNPIVF
jgi:hypothetical protein